MLAISSALIFWGLVILAGVMLFWTVLRFALTTCEADTMTRGLANLFCLILLLAGLSLGVMITRLPIQ